MERREAPLAEAIAQNSTQSVFSGKQESSFGKTTPVETDVTVNNGRREKSKVTSNGMTYADWLTKAIESGADRRLTLAEIYDWMVANVPGLSGQRYLHSSKGWKNAVRHTLSVNPRFCKIARAGRPSFWTISVTNSSTPKLDQSETKCQKKRKRAASSSAATTEEERSPKLARTVSSEGAVTPPPSTTPPAINPEPVHTKSADMTNANAQLAAVLDYYQIPLALAAAAASARRIFKLKPTYNFRTSPTSAFDSFRPRQEAMG